MSLFSAIGDICKVAVHAVCQVYAPGPVGAAISTGLGVIIDEVTDDPEPDNLGDPGVGAFAEAGANIFNAMQTEGDFNFDAGAFRV